MKQWLKRAEVAKKLSVSYNFLRLELETREDFPNPVVLSPKLIVYDNGAIEAWMQAQQDIVNQKALEFDYVP